MRYHYRYDVTGSCLDFGIKTHPQEQMRKLGLHVIKSEPCTVADCWFFRTDNDIQDVPKYLHRMSDSFRFSDEYDKVSESKDTQRTIPIYNSDGSLTDYGKFIQARTERERKLILQGFKRRC